MNDASAKSTLSISVRTLAVLLGGLAMFGPFSIDYHSEEELDRIIGLLSEVGSASS